MIEQEDFTLPDAGNALPDEGAELPLEASEPEKEPEEIPTVTNESQYDQEELLKIFDEILFKGGYQEELQISRNCSATFKSRTGEEMAAISRTLDKMDFKLVGTIEDQRVLLYLAYSLVEFNGKPLGSLKPVPGRYDFVGKLASPIIARLSDKLAEFDNKVYLAMEAASENF